MYSNYLGETLDVYNIHGIITLDMDGGFLAEASAIAVKSDGTCFISSSRHMIPKIIGTTSGRGIYNEVTGELDMSNIVINSDLATVATSGDYNDLTNKPTIPEVPAWALESTKPTYTAAEVGAVSTSDLNNYVKKEETSSLGNSTSISTRFSRNFSSITLAASPNQGYNASISISSGEDDLGYSSISINAS